MLTKRDCKTIADILNENIKVLVDAVNNHAEKIAELQERVSRLEPKEVVPWRSCPFCGCADIALGEDEEYNLFYVECTNCEAKGPECKTISEAGRYWNGL